MYYVGLKTRGVPQGTPTTARCTVRNDCTDVPGRSCCRWKRQIDKRDIISVGASIAQICPFDRRAPGELIRENTNWNLLEFKKVQQFLFGNIERLCRA
jgi:hypothetical protein